jgi:hypothetical protein
MGKAPAVIVVLLVAILIALVGLILVIAYGSHDGTKRSGHLTTLPAGQTLTQDEMKKQGVEPVVPSKPVDNSRIAETYQVGKTYKAMVNFALSGRGSHKDYGLDKVVNIYYLGEMEVLRKVESNDGQTMVLTLAFPMAKNVCILTKIEGIRLELGTVATGLLEAGGEWEGLPPGWTLMATQAFNEAASTDLVKNLASQVAQDRTAKCFRFVDGIQGKKVRVKYVNGRGITELTSLDCSLDNDQLQLMVGMAMASDVYMLPNLESKVGDTWTIQGGDMLSVLDPSAHARVTGEITAQRSEDIGQDEGRQAVIDISSGTLNLNDWDNASEQTGWWTPRGKMKYSFADKIITQAELTGEFQWEKRSTNHILFEARMVVKPQYKVLYSCEIQK